MLPITHNNKFRVMLLISIVLLLFFIILSVFIGSKEYDPNQILSFFKNDTNSLERSIILKRIYRTVLAILAGSALSISGLLMQTTTRNNLSSPSILGVDSGAAFLIVFFIINFNVTYVYYTIVISIIGSTIAFLLVMLISSIGKSKANPLKLVLAGSCVTIIFNSLTYIMMLDKTYVADLFRFWQVGSLGGANPVVITAYIPFYLIAMTVTIILIPSLNSLILGDEVALSQGINVARVRIFSSITAVILSAITTAVCGPIAFVGLIVPNLCKIIIGSDFKKLFVLTFINGASFLIAADILSRIIARPQELEVGVMTALIGGPLLIIFVSRRGFNNEG